MSAPETHLREIIEGNRQSVVPPYQPHYRWNESREEILRADRLNE